MNKNQKYVKSRKEKKNISWMQKKNYFNLAKIGGKKCANTK